MTPAPTVSVVVSTRNRARTLAQSSAALLAVDYPPGQWEVLIVDNRSTDQTQQVAQEIARGRSDFVRVVMEPQVGLSAARNAGVRHARGEIVAFLDDDAFPDATWLVALVGAMSESGALVAGGPVEPWFEGELPAWFGDRYLPYLAAWDRGAETHSLTYNDYPRGANMAFRRTVFDDFGTFSLHLGRSHTSLLSCEEVELCLRVERSGGRILYAPKARVRHLLEAGRITPRWLARRFYAQGRSEAIVEWQHGGWRGLRRGWLRWLRMTVEAARGTNQPSDPIYARCHRRALAGYSHGALSAPASVPRYRPPGHRSPEWLPWSAA
jgi:glycosyltransferase involved in cell wall biosynthesis